MEKSRIKLLFFGITHDIAECRETEWEVEHEQTVGQLRRQLEEKFPKLRELKSFAIAVNEEYASENDPLHDRDNVALIPPVSGG